MSQDLRLRAGPRPRLPAPKSSAATLPVAAAAVPDAAGSGAAGTPCRAHWPANSGSPANAASVSLPAGTHRCNNVLAAASAETSTRSPSRRTCDAVVGDTGLDCSHPRRDTVYGPREPFTPARSSLGAELRTPLRGAFADASPPAHSPADPPVSLSLLPPELNPPRPFRRHAPLAAMLPWRTFAAMRILRHQLMAARRIYAAKVAPFLAAIDRRGMMGRQGGDSTKILPSRRRGLRGGER